MKEAGFVRLFLLYIYTGSAASFMVIQFTYDLIRYICERYPGKEIFHCKRSGKWTGITTEQFAEEVEKLTVLLISEGVRKGECVASIFSYNTYEWNIIDMALARIGAVHLPVYPTISDSDYLFILKQAEVRWVFITDQLLYNKLSQLICELDLVKNIVSIEKLPSVDNFQQLIAESPLGSEKYKKRLQARIRKSDPDDVCTILYTSGTTGFPKGVMLTHRNLCTNTEAAAVSQPLHEGDRVISFLPLCHIYERVAVYQFILKGVEVFYAENLKALLGNMREIRPDGTTVVPRLLEKIIAGFQTRAINSSVFLRFFILWSIRLGYRYDIHDRGGMLYRIKYTIADRFVYSHVRSLLGGHVRYMGCGGAPIDARILRFFWAAGIPVYEGYGLTECSPLVALNHPGDNGLRIGTVGPPLNDIQIRIAADREILVRGPNLMKGYFKDENQTRAVILDGWLCTGDLGEFVDDRFLKIVGRKKEMFKTSYGKYIVPQAIENRFLESRLIDYIIVIGEGKHFASAVISPNFEYCRTLLPGSEEISAKSLIRQPNVIRAFEKEISAVNRQLGKTERINRFLLVEDTWSTETGELSATQKLRRNTIIHKYAARIRDMYREDKNDDIVKNLEN